MAKFNLAKKSTWRKIISVRVRVPTVDEEDEEELKEDEELDEEDFDDEEESLDYSGGMQL